jgi:tetratricopeptide (TPR) repeat protein
VLVYRSEHTRNKVQAILARSLKKSGEGVILYSVDKYHYDIPLELVDHPKHKQAVFFVSGLSRGGGRGYSNAFRALNMHREYLVEGNIKAIFWLTVNEAKQLTRFSPDFWAFRHKVVEFLDLPSINKLEQPKFLTDTFHDLYMNHSADFLKWIQTGKTYLTLGCIDEAIFNFRKVLRQYPDEKAIYLQIAEVYLSIGQLPAAGRALKKVNEGITDKPYFLKELKRLNQAVNSMQYTSGGFLEPTT